MILTDKEMKELRKKLDDTLDSVKADLEKLQSHKHAGGVPPDSPLLESWINRGRYVMAMEHGLEEYLKLMREKEKIRKGNTAMVSAFLLCLALATFFFWLSGAEFVRSSGTAWYYGISLFK